MKCAEGGLAILGGTFDPVHIGHLRSAVEVREALGAEQVKMIPSFLPPHRGQPDTTPEQRLAMLELAIRGVDFLMVDDREIRREGKSYTIDTLESLRAETGEDCPLTLVMGSDAWEILDSWRDWQRLTDLAHILVLDRGGEEPVAAEVVRKWAGPGLVPDPAAFRERAHGLICRMSLTRLDVSATRIREILKSGRSPDYLMPEAVIRYIRQEGLYHCQET